MRINFFKLYCLQFTLLCESSYNPIYVISIISSNLYKLSKRPEVSQICLKNTYIVFLEILLCTVHQIVHVFEHKADENERPGEKNAAEGG